MLYNICQPLQIPHYEREREALSKPLIS
jgi:hypothetical protein